jgi:sugar lactone lactonase YvrE
MTSAGAKAAVHADLADAAVGYLRDMAVARDGTAYVTSFDADAAGPDCYASARVVLATPDGKIRSVASNFAHPNGLAITSAHEVLVAETLGNRVLAFQIGNEGALLHRRVFANFEWMSPLGICADSEGAVWAAAARQPLFVRVLQGGRVTHRVHVPGGHAVACQLGGQDGRTLFCLTVAADLGNCPNSQQTGCVEATSVDIPGARRLPSLAIETDPGNFRVQALQRANMIDRKATADNRSLALSHRAAVPMPAPRQGITFRRISDAEKTIVIRAIWISTSRTGVTGQPFSSS